MKYYHSRYAEHSHEIAKFLSENQIPQKDIVQIYSDKYFHYVIFVSDKEYFYGKGEIV